jgi:hypothetical protein
LLAGFLLRMAVIRNFHTRKQCCGSGIFIPDPGCEVFHPGSEVFHPGSEFFHPGLRLLKIPDLRSASASKNLSIS